MIDVVALNLAPVSIEPERTLDVIAGEINGLKEEARTIIISNSIEIGRRLCEARNMVPDGQWGAWLKDNVEYSERTAQYLMALFNEYGLKGVPAGLERASLSNALLLIGKPEEIRQELLESGEAENLSSRELKARIRELEAERDAQQVTIDSLMESQQRAEDEAERASAEAADLNRQLEDQAARMDAMRQATLRASDRESASIEERTKLREENHRLTAEYKRIESELEKARARPIQTVEVVPEAVAKELSELRSRVRATESEQMILYRAAYESMIDAYQRCVDQMEEVIRFDGGQFGAIRDQMANLGKSIENQMRAWRP